MTPDKIIESLEPAKSRARAHRIAGNSLLLGVRGLRVTDAGELEQVSGFARELVKKKDALDAERKAAVGPLNEVVKRINGWFKPAIETLTDAERHCKRLIGDYQLRYAEEQRRQFAAAQAAMVAGDMSATTAALAASSAAAPSAAVGVGVREVWRAEVVDAAAVPREYLIVNEKALGAVARSVPKGGTPPTIPGVRFSKDTQVSVRR